MNSEQKRNPRITPIFSYAILVILVVLCVKKWLFAGFLVWFIVAFTLLVIRDISPYLGSFKKLHHRVFDWKAFFHAMKTKSLGFFDSILIINRVTLFPFLLTLYITFILVKQLDILSLSAILSEKSWLEYSILSGVIWSGCMTVIRESQDEFYYKSIPSQMRTRLFIAFTLLLTVGAIVIIFSETASLGLLSIPISTISGLLVYLIGTLILEEENPS